jgi:membrane protein implicated in regulation of membrane protease activity
MNNEKMLFLPFKSLAAALLFSVFLGPVGLLYASTIGGVVMIIIGCVVASSLLWVPILIVWLISCVWSVVAVNRYNQRRCEAIQDNNAKKNNPT